MQGFNPDPSVCWIERDYYIATATFEGYPGVQIHRSTDLANWTLVARPLARVDLLDMRGVPDSCGIWAPCLSDAAGRFWLVYTDVKRFAGAFQDVHNFRTSCVTIDGEWAARKYVNASGFDPPPFHDDDGREWVLDLRWNHRGPGTGGNPAIHLFDGIELQEWHPDQGLLGPPRVNFQGSALGMTEGAHLFKRGDWYYLTTAEGGTGYDLAVTMARPREIDGSYELHPQRHVLTARFAPESPLQRISHGQ